MNSATSLPSLSEPNDAALHLLLERVVEKVRREKRRALACYGFSLEGGDPLRLLEQLTDSEGFRFFWDHPASSFAIAAGGAAKRFIAEGAERFRNLAGLVDNFLHDAVTGSADGDSCGGPYALGGFSFFDALNSENWPGFGAAQLVVPEWMMIRTGGRTLALVTAEAGPEDTLFTLSRKLKDIILRLRAALLPGNVPEGNHHRNCAFSTDERGDGRSRWMNVVRNARERIRAGGLSKVVLARALDLICAEKPSPFRLLSRLRKAYPDCYNFLVDPGKGQVFLGATPERLARFENGHVKLAAMAGTVPRGNTPEADEALARYLLESRKEREEHNIVVDGLLESLEGLGAVSYPSEPVLVHLNNVHHLYTPITLKPKRHVSVLSLLGGIHPTAAVGGHPREEAFRLIRESEHFDRGWYGAPVGWMNAQGEAEFAVALRSGVMRENRLQLYAGGGIVADSDPGQEYEETQIKFQPMLTALAEE